MYRGRGGNYRGGGPGNGRGIQGDVWYSPHNQAPRDAYHASGHQYQGGASNNRIDNTRHGGGSDQEVLICKHHAINDRCRFGPKCLYKHNLKRILLLPEICRSGVNCLTFFRMGDSTLEMFASGQGTGVKRLSLAADITGGVSLKKQDSFNLDINQVVGKESSSRDRRGPPQLIFSLRCINDCLFAGIKTGHISVFHIPTETSTLLYGHTNPVKDIILIDNAVISACDAGKICIWSFDAALNSFKCVNSLETKCVIECLVEVSDGVNRQLWAGGNAITVIDLSTLSVVRSMPVPNRDLVKKMVCYGQHVIVALWSGDCVVLSPNGDVAYQSGGYGPDLTSMDGLQTEKGDLLLLGSESGSLNVIGLPAFQLEGVLPFKFDIPRGAKWRGISVIASLGGGLFAVACYEGNIHLFRSIGDQKNA
ncbi:hypothetical protein BgAZ_401250 [Babesia gibsoni]|uniref:C3H1-type domain-containing protein n=1 Tax=Babesia gibsoni TaxID=33632 RepID=A0AAD8P807_BABGI|nr:hypothetical protein BgAZ_401250 [Babesia gibsoni]